MGKLLRYGEWTDLRNTWTRGQLSFLSTYLKLVIYIFVMHPVHFDGEKLFLPGATKSPPGLGIPILFFFFRSLRFDFEQNTYQSFSSDDLIFIWPKYIQFFNNIELFQNIHFFKNTQFFKLYFNFFKNIEFFKNIKFFENSKFFKKIIFFQKILNF